MTFTIEKASSIRVFLDDTDKGDYDKTRGENIPLPPRTRIIAVKGSIDGILLSTSDGFYSGQLGKWLCSKEFTPGWTNVSFNTTGRSDWLSPEILLRKAADPKLLPGKWIKAVDAKREDEIYCRGDYGE